MNPTNPNAPAAPAPDTNEVFLSPEERQNLQRMMGHPTDYPKAMMSHIREWLSVNPPDIPISQVQGFNAFRPVVALTAGSIAINGNDTWQGDSTTQPKLTGLGSGSYFVLVGFQSAYNSGNNIGLAQCAPVVNNASPSTADSVRTRPLLGDNNTVQTEDRYEGSCMYFKLIDVDQPNSQINVRYRSSDGNVAMTNVYLVAFKYANRRAS